MCFAVYFIFLQFLAEESFLSITPVMLKSLHIKNFVLINEVAVEFSPRLNVITGETGSGKSVLLSALNLCFGERGEAGLVGASEKQATLTAVIDIAKLPDVSAHLHASGISNDGELIMRRIISADGKSRAFINDTPTTITALKNVAEYVAEMQSQHEQFALSDTAKVRALLDEYAGNESMLVEVSTKYSEIQAIQSRLKATEESVKAAEREREYSMFVQRELSALSPQVGEESALADTKASFAGRKKQIDAVTRALSEICGSNSAYSAIFSAQKALSRAGESVFDPVMATMDKALAELSETEKQLEEILENASSGADFEKLDDRIHALRSAARKYGVSADELPQILHEAEQKLELSADGSKLLEKISQQLSAARNEYMLVAQKLTDSRVKAALKLEKSIIKELASLKMEKAIFKIEITKKPNEDFSANGVDDISFQVATIEGAKLQPIAKIASGGELSRIMLAIKCTLTNTKKIPTIVFDEIDTGISGAVADAVGKKLSVLADITQVIAVTHQPQVAAKADAHFVISKAIKSGKTTAVVSRLSDDEREEEVARMLSGATVTTEARAAAQKLIERAA